MNNEIEAIKAIKVELDKIKESGSLSDFFSILKKGLLPSGKTIKKEHRYMAFLLCIDAISPKLYSKDSENGYYAIELSKYTNGETGYFDLLFKHASLLIRDLIFEEIEMSPEKDVKFKDYKMNVILKMDTHNNPQGKSKYSLITHAGDFFITDENCNSLAYTLFFDYSLFCNSKKDNKELTDDEIYTVHKEFINEKTARSFAYQFEESNLIKFIDGNKEVETNYDLNKGEKHYKDFISYILNEELIEKDDSDFSRYLRDSNTDNSWKKGKSLSSFSYYNLGIPGFESWGTLMIECNKDVQTVYEKFYRRGGENDDTLLLSQIKNVISALKKIDDEYNDALNKQRIRRESEKSAKAAIMSRNMSHNLGSHVMFYIKQRLESVEKILQTGTLQDLVKSDSIEGIKEKIRDASTQPGEEMPFLVGLGRFINYLQERQDYIATVATDYIPYKTSISFKDAIYDELKPDLRAQRHNSDKTVKGKQPANLLLDYIAYSEGFHPSKCIKLKFGDEFDGTSQKVPNDLRKLNVALPSGNLGRQAFFSIMENIIRNTAKHDGITNENKGILGFQFDILDGSQLDNFNFIASAEDPEKEIQKDRMLKHLNCYGNKQNKENYYYIGITANTDGSLKDINDILRKIQDGLIDLYIHNNGQMRDEYKGIKEMRISAAWMRGYGIDTDIPINEPPALAVRDNGGHIQYIVCLPKPKKIAFVVSKEEIIKVEQMPEGLKLFQTLPAQKEDSTDDKKVVKRFVNDSGIADYEMIVSTKEHRKRLQPYVGSRIYTSDDTEINNLIKKVQEDYAKKEGDRISAVGDVYIKWLEQKFKCQQGEKLPKLVINDGQAYENHISDTNGSRERMVELGDDRIMFNSGDSTSDQLIYSKHYNPKEHRFYDDAPFVEGISGGNSTDRLLRQDEWTKEWYVKHMTAALTKVAIFDERIYSNFIRQNTSKGWSEEMLTKWLEGQKDKLKDGNPKRSLWIEMRKSISTIKKEDIGLLLEKTNDGYVFTKDGAKLTSFLHLLPQIIPADCSVADLYRRKGVWAFNIEVEEIGNGKKCVIIKGYTKENGETEIARMRYKTDQQTIVLDVDDDFKKKFHFITIHQGVLDKIYSALGIRKEEKNKVTDELFDKFSNSEKEDEYLPQFIIHSGRSKPNDTDMPQKQPFIQFAALDHAVKDCKYTLTELLYSAHYES